MNYRIPLQLDPQPEGGFTVTSSLLPELISEGDTVEEALENVKDALAAVAELYEDTGKALPAAAQLSNVDAPIAFETLLTVS